MVVPGVGGIFEVHVDGQRVWHKGMLGRYPDPEDVVPALEPALGSSA